jgi:hypothetical protein
VNWNHLACIATAIGITLATPLGAQTGSTLPRLLERYSTEKLIIEATQLAIYADQLEALRLSYLTKDNTAAAEQAATEAKTVLSQLKVIQEKLSKPPEPVDGSNRDSALNTLFNQDEATEGKEAEKPRRKGSNILRPNTAKWIPADEPKRKFWALENAAQQWTLEDLSPGKYKVRLEFRAMRGESGGTGQLEITGNSTPIPFRINSTDETGKKIQSQDIAMMEIEKCPVDLTIRVTGHVAAETPLFELVAVWLQEVPADGVKVKGPEPQTPRKETERKKVDF